MNSTDVGAETEGDRDTEICIVPATGDVWPFYLRHGVFVATANKYFRTVPRFAFYSSRLVRPLAPMVLATFESVRLEDQVISSLALSADPLRRRVGEALADTAENSVSDAPVKVVLLTAPSDPRTLSFGEIVHEGRGAWVTTRRYVRLGKLMDATTTAEVTEGSE